MPGTLLDGKRLAKEILAKIQDEISIEMYQIHIGIILVGNNPASLSYIKKKQEAAEQVGIEVKIAEFPESVLQEELEQHIASWNEDENMHGYIVQLPLPEHINLTKLIHTFDSKKDIDGFHQWHMGSALMGIDEDEYLPPATPQAVTLLLDANDISVSGKNVCIVGSSNLVGKPLSAMLLSRMATVTTCNVETKDLSSHTKIADIIISATGVPHLIKEDMVKEGVITIDVGFSMKDGKIYGDIDTQTIKEKAAAYAPVPGGVGPVTVASLMKNSLKAYKYQHNVS